MNLNIKKVNNGYIVTNGSEQSNNPISNIMKGVFDKLEESQEDPILREAKKQAEKDENLTGEFVFSTLLEVHEFIDKVDNVNS